MIVDNNLIWWTGVVEDRDDPEKLGRCRVRIFGYHTPDTNLLPTSDLPWAIPLQSITSAATSGIGHTPVGIVPGTWVMGWFLDGDEAQRPLILGTLAGKPVTSVEASRKLKQQETDIGYLRTEDGKVIYDDKNVPITSVAATTDETKVLPPLTVNQVSTLFLALSNKLSNNQIGKEGDNGKLGKYQFSVFNLIELGYVKRPLEQTITDTWTEYSSNWTGLDGIQTKNGFLSNEAVQEKAMFALTKNNYNTLLRLGKIKETDDYKIVGGLLSSAHVLGVKNADNLNKKDEDGNRGRTYFIVGNTALGGTETDVDKSFDYAGNYLPSEDTAGDVLNNEELKNVKGFQDPNKKYPRFEYTGLSDINKLAIGDTSHLSFKVKENRKVDKIAIAKTSLTWDEPSPAYGAGYPYNQVIETEAGHVIELDSTPGAERIQVFHKTGTYIEVDVNGSMVRKTVGENYEIIDRNNFTYVKGASTLTVEGKTSIYVKDDAVIEVDGDLSVTGHGSTSVSTASSASIVAESFIVSAKNNITMVTEGDFNLQGKDISFYAKGGAMTQKASKDISLESGTSNTISIKGGIALLLDAAVVKTKMGANRIKEVAFAAIGLPKKKTPNTEQIPVLQREVLAKSNYLFDAGDVGSEEYQQQLIKNGTINSKIETKVSGIDLNADNVTSAGNADKLALVDSTEIKQFKYFPRSFILSNNKGRIFTLDDMLKDGGLVAQRGLTEQQIVHNLKILAINCLDPIKAKYPDMRITSGFRPQNPETTSDHGLGAAVDIKFVNTSKRQYKEIAEWIVANVPHRQVLLEYYFSSDSSMLVSAWIHLSLLVQDGSIVKSKFAPVQTFVNHQAKYTKLVNLA